MTAFCKRILIIASACILFCSCGGASPKNPPVTDGFSCSVTAEFEQYETVFNLKKSGGSISIEYVLPDAVEGMEINISPAGNILSFNGLSCEMDLNVLNSSINGAIIDALDYDYSAAEYKNGEYICCSGADEFRVSVFDDGRISTINFFKYNCKCYFNY